MGVITGIWGAFLGAICGGSHFNIMGPTGALSGILFRFAVQYGANMLPYLALMSGVQICFVFLFNCDKYVMFIPSGVNAGFTLGVAFIIAGGQLASAFGITGLPVHHEFVENFYEAITHIGQCDWHAALVFLVSWSCLFTAIKLRPKVPWGVPLAVIGILLGYLSEGNYIFHLNTLRSKFGELSASLYTPPAGWGTSAALSMGKLFSEALPVSFVSVLETLISGKIADGMTKTNMNARREVFGAAMANVGAGLAGGLPATAALARTALNIRSGARTRLAGMINAISTTVIALALLRYFSYLPLPIVAALLFQVAIGMIEVETIRRFWKMDVTMLLITLLVAVLCVVIDPTTGIVVGVIIGLLRHAQHVAIGYSEVITKPGVCMTHEHLDGHTQESEQPSSWMGSLRQELHKCFADPDVEEAHQHNGNGQQTHQTVTSDGTVIYRIIGKLTYINAFQHEHRLEKIARQQHDCKAVVISLRYTYYVDVDGVEAIEHFGTTLQEEGKLVLFSGVSPVLMPLLTKSKWFEAKHKDGLVFTTYQMAVAWLKEHHKLAPETQV